MPFCGKCGKWIEEGQVCSCGAGTNTKNNNSDSNPPHMFGTDYRYSDSPAPTPGMTNPYPGGSAAPGTNPDSGMFGTSGSGSGYGPAPTPGMTNPYPGGSAAPGTNPDSGMFGTSGSGSGYGPAPTPGMTNPYPGGSATPGTNPDPNMYGAPGSINYNTLNNIGSELSGLLGMLSTQWVNFKNRTGLGEPETNDVDYYERNLEIVPQCIDPDSGEVPIKQYDMAVLRTRLILSRAEGRLQVTNKRVIFRASGRSLMGRTTLQHEFAIDEIAGVKLRKDHRFSFLNVFGVLVVMSLGSTIGTALYQQIFQSNVLHGISGFLSLILATLSLLPFVFLYKKFPLKLFLTSIGYALLVSEYRNVIMTGQSFWKTLWTIPVAIMALFLLFIAWIICWVPNLIMNVETKGTQPAVEIRRKESNLFNMFQKPEYTGFAEVLPWKDTELAIIELWAMISDLQKYGDDAIKQWKK